MLAGMLLKFLRATDLPHSLFAAETMISDLSVSFWRYLSSSSSLILDFLGCAYTFISMGRHLQEHMRQYQEKDGYDVSC